MNVSVPSGTTIGLGFLQKSTMTDKGAVGLELQTSPLSNTQNMSSKSLTLEEPSTNLKRNESKPHTRERKINLSTENNQS